MPFQITAEELIEETHLLEQLVELLVQARATRPDKAPLTEILDQQATVCEGLAERRAQRAARLQAEGYGARDLLVAMLTNTPKAEHDRAIAVFGAFVKAAERAQAEIDINREFFAVALAAVEDALMAAVPGGQPATYDLCGGKRPGGSVMVSTVT